MTGYESITELFEEKLSIVRKQLALRSIFDDEAEMHCYSQIDRMVKNMKISLRDIKLKLKAERDAFNDFKNEAFPMVRRLKVMTAYMMDNIPTHLPPLDGTTNSTAQPPTRPESSHKSPKERQKSGKKYVESPEIQGDTPPQSFVTLKKNLFRPKITYLTNDEYKGIPGYMRGRISYDQINSAVDELNKAQTARYKVLRTARNKLSDRDRKRCEVYRSQNNGDTKGLHFFVDDDIKAFSNFKLDSIGRKIITILRHCGRIREVRGQGLVRYCVV